MTDSRTVWVEQQAARFCEAPFVAETVFHSARFDDRGIEKEVCDILLILRRAGIVVSLKAQEDPEARSGEKLDRWCAKGAEKAVNQIVGALRTIRSRPYWCVHRRRGLTMFEPGSVTVVRGVVLVETMGDEVVLPDRLPLEHDGVPFTYMSLNDFLNLVDEVRSFPDVLGYLDARDQIPARVRRTVGSERIVFGWFLLHEGRFNAMPDLRRAATYVGARQQLYDSAIQSKRDADHGARLLEFACDGLGKPSPTPDRACETIPQADRFKWRWRVQEHICDLSLAMRRELGGELARVGTEVREAGDTRTSVVTLTAKPNFVYLVFASATHPEDREFQDEMKRRLMAAMAHASAESGLAIGDRVGSEFQFAYARQDVPTEEDIQRGRELFGGMRIDRWTGSLVPAWIEPPQPD